MKKSYSSSSTSMSDLKISSHDKEDNSLAHVSSQDVESSSSGSDTVVDMTDLENDDPALAEKIRLINDAIDEIGFTWYHFKLFCIAGFGYSGDSEVMMVQSSVYKYVDWQMWGNGKYPLASEMGYVGSISGVITFCFGADLIGRKLCFNLSLLMSAVFCFFTGGTSSYAMYIIGYMLAYFGAGGNLGTDVTVFLEWLPHKYGYLSTMMASWWGVGQTLASVISWGFMPNHSCKEYEGCTSRINRGWRYSWYTNGAIVMFFALLRIFYLKADETPKFLVAHGRDEEAVAVIQKIAKQYNRKCSLTVDMLEDCGKIRNDYFSAKDESHSSFRSLMHSLRNNIGLLFRTKKSTRTITLMMVSWTLMGVAYATFYNFLYTFISQHGGNVSNSTYITYRNATIANVVGILGPFMSGWMVTWKWLGRRGTMLISALLAMGIMWGYTTCKTSTQDAIFSSLTYFTVNMLYSTLYAFTPEALGTRSRTTGVGLCMVCVRVAGAISPVIYWFGSSSSSGVPLWVCGGLIGAIGFIALGIPFDSTKQRPV